jgi:N-acetylneuraminate lyase
MAQIASAAPQLPFYYYHIPALTGIGMDMIEFLKLSEDEIPNLAGIKYTASTLHEYQACINYRGGKFDILFGYDEMLLGALAVGAKGAIGSTYTFSAKLYLQVMALYNRDEKELARQMQSVSVEMVRCLVQFPGIPAQRAIMKSLGFDLGPCRLPLKELSSKDAQTLIGGLDALHFFDIVNKDPETSVNVAPAV